MAPCPYRLHLIRNRTRAYAVSLTLVIAFSALAAPGKLARAGEPLYERLCDAILDIAEGNPEAARKVRTDLLRDHLKQNLVQNVEDLARGNLRYLGFTLADEPGQSWANRIPHRTSSAQKGFFKYVEELIDQKIIPDHLDDATLAGESPDRIYALEKVIDLSVDVLMNEMNPARAGNILRKIIAELPAVRIQETRTHTQKLDREKLFLNQNKQGQLYKLIDPETGQITETKINESIQYTGRNDEVSRVELVDKDGRLIFKANPNKTKNPHTSVEEKKFTLPVITGAKVRVFKKDGSQVTQPYFEFSPNFPMRPLPTQAAIANNDLSGGHLSEDVEKFIEVYSDLLDPVVKHPPVKFRIPGIPGREFTLRQFEINFKTRASKSERVIKTTLDSQELFDLVVREAIRQIDVTAIPKDQRFKEQNIEVPISIQPDRNPDGSRPPWTINTSIEGVLPITLYLKDPKNPKADNTIYPKPIELKPWPAPKEEVDPPFPPVQ